MVNTRVRVALLVFLVALESVSLQAQDQTDLELLKCVQSVEEVERELKAAHPHMKDLCREVRQETSCFDPLRDPVAQQLIESSISGEKRASPLDLETEKKRVACALKRGWERSGLDPRMILFRMAGESGGNVDAINSQSKAYGLFQFLGAFPKQKMHKTRIRECQKKKPTLSKTAIQTAFYVDEYVRVFQKLAPYGCKKGKTWASYSAEERLAYLGLGSCSSSSLKHTRAHCRDSARYRQTGCPILSSLEGMNYTGQPVPSVPLCKQFEELDCPTPLEDQELDKSSVYWCDRL